MKPRSMSTELIAVETAVAEFDRVAAGIAKLNETYAGVVYDVRTAKGMADAKDARSAVREPRYELERVRKAAKEPILALGRQLDARAKAITAEILLIEEPIVEQIDNEEARKEAEKQAKIAAEMKRVADLQERVAGLRGNQSLTSLSHPSDIAGHSEFLESIPVDASFEEFQQQAADAKAAGLARLTSLLAAAEARVAEQARIKAEREELAKLRAEQAKRAAEERSRIEQENLRAKAIRDEELRKQREAQAIADAKAKAERDAEAAKHAADLKAQCEEQARIDREKQAEWDRREAEQKAAREELAAQQAAIEAKKRKKKKAVKQDRPTDIEIIQVLAMYYRVHESKIVEWILAMELSNPELCAP